jgi:hypothetical protein
VFKFTGGLGCGGALGLGLGGMLRSVCVGMMLSHLVGGLGCGGALGLCLGGTLLSFFSVDITVVSVLAPNYTAR